MKSNFDVDEAMELIMYAFAQMNRAQRKTTRNVLKKMEPDLNLNYPHGAVLAEDTIKDSANG